MVSNYIDLLTPVLLAGGQGSRLGHLAADVPKALLEVGGQPFIQIPLDALKGEGFPRAIIATGHLAEAFMPILGGAHRGMELIYSREERPLGTAGALVHALPHIKTSHILAMNSDSFIPIDWQAYFHWHFSLDAPASMVLAPADQGSRYGNVTLGAGGRVRTFLEKQSGGGEWINAGIYILDKNVVAKLPMGQFHSLENQFFPRLCSGALFGFPVQGKLVDIGTPKALARVRKEGV